MDKLVHFDNDSVEMPESFIVKMALAGGLILACSLIGLFMILKVLNLVPMIELRLIDFIILGVGILMCFRHFQSKSNGNVKYLQGLLFGVSISAIATIPFALFLAVYFQWLDPELLIQLKRNSPLLGPYISPFKIAVTTIVGGLGWGMVLSFLLMQYFQNDAHQIQADQAKQE